MVTVPVEMSRIILQILILRCCFLGGEKVRHNPPNGTMTGNARQYTTVNKERGGVMYDERGIMEDECKEKEKGFSRKYSRSNSR